MNNRKKISAEAILALKDALTNIYWKKADLRQFIELTIENSTIVSTIDWSSNLKYESVSLLIDIMLEKQDVYQSDLLNLIQSVSNMSDFSHLEHWDDACSKISKAQSSVNRLRNQSKGYFDVIEELEKAKSRKNKSQAKIKASIDYQNKLEDLKKLFFEIASNPNQQKRGYQFERFLNELFIFFDLDPKSSFKIVGEQIDGAFTFDNTDYLLEAKWQQDEIRSSDLFEFGGKIDGKLKNTLGLFISLGPYSSECYKSKSQILRSMILMDGEELMQVLDDRISLNDLIYSKRRHASQTGDIYYKFNK